MHLLLVYIKGREQPVMLGYKTEIAAKAAFDSPSPMMTDDYGHRLRTDTVVAIMLQDLAGELDMQGEIAIANAKKQAYMQRQAASDSSLRFITGQGGRPPGLIG